jgi:hypothetical protein
MEIVHHFGIRLRSDADRMEFADIGIDLPSAGRAPSGNMITSFEIAEHDPRWMDASRIVAKFQITDSVRTEFSPSEFAAASAICILASSHRGYPMPSAKRGFLAATYDLSDYCAKCGIGCRQVRPFRFNSTLDLKRTIMQLKWIFDEYFVSREIWTAIFRPFAIGYWPVVFDGTGNEIDSVVQLRISHYADLKHDEASSVVCSICGRTKTKMDLRGFCPKPGSAPAPIFKSTQYFGSDAGAFRRVLVAPVLYEAIKKSGLRGIEFYPCDPGLMHLENQTAFDEGRPGPC